MQKHDGEKYTRESLFLVKWRKTPKYQELNLPKIRRVYRIYHQESRYIIKVKCGEETPWVLGEHQSLLAAKYGVYDSLLYWNIYKKGVFASAQNR